MLAERRAAFCARLKAARQKSGISLEQIAASTKISRSLFVGLERNDLSRWPKGLYRRSYVRDYLTAINLKRESLVAEFAQLFPDDEKAEGPEEQPDHTCALSMTLAEGQPEAMAKARRRVIGAAIDLGLVCVGWAGAAWGAEGHIESLGIIVALTYYSITTATLGRSLGCVVQEKRQWRAAQRKPPIDLEIPGEGELESAGSGQLA